MMSDLKACPFCGRIPDIEDCGKHRWFIRCKCGIAQDKLFFQKCDAVRAWNKRKELRVKETNVPITDTISRQAAIGAADSTDYIGLAIEDVKKVTDEVIKALKRLPSAQPEIVRCKDCVKHNKAISNTPYKEYVCPLVKFRGKAHGHEFDYQYCAYGKRNGESDGSD